MKKKLKLKLEKDRRNFAYGSKLSINSFKYYPIKIVNGLEEKDYISIRFNDRSFIHTLKSLKQKTNWRTSRMKFYEKEYRDELISDLKKLGLFVGSNVPTHIMENMIETEEQIRKDLKETREMLEKELEERSKKAKEKEDEYRDELISRLQDLEVYPTTDDIPTLHMILEEQENVIREMEMESEEIDFNIPIPNLMHVELKKRGFKVIDLKLDEIENGLYHDLNLPCLKVNEDNQTNVELVNPKTNSETKNK